MRTSILILLRVTGVTKLPNAIDMDYSRFQAGQRASDTPETWDAQGKTDQFTLHQLRFAGVRCRVLGTYQISNAARDNWALRFGSDVSNFYSGRGLKVYRPTLQALDTIVNFSKPILGDAHPLAGHRVRLGRVRYASTERPGAAGVPVNVDPTDLIARRTALFGMSRTGKSNTTKMIASAVFRLRGSNPVNGRVGQLIFDVNGEYANDNPIDRGCLRNIHTAIPSGRPIVRTPTSGTTAATRRSPAPNATCKTAISSSSSATASSNLTAPGTGGRRWRTSLLHSQIGNRVRRAV